MSDTVDACPECDTTSGIYRRRGMGDTGRWPSDDATYVCRECGATFAEPNEREAQHTNETRKGRAGKLAKADPDEVGGD
jgi:transposase-like protein